MKNDGSFGGKIWPNAELVVTRFFDWRVVENGLLHAPITSKFFIITAKHKVEPLNQKINMKDELVMGWACNLMQEVLLNFNYRLVRLKTEYKMDSAENFRFKIKIQKERQASLIFIDKKNNKINRYNHCHVNIFICRMIKTSKRIRLSDEKLLYTYLYKTLVKFFNVNEVI